MDPTTQPATDPNAHSVGVSAVIILMTIVLVQCIKNTTAGTRAGEVPVLCWTVLVAGVLTALAWAADLLEGNVWQALFFCLQNVLLTNGTYNVPSAMKYVNRIAAIFLACGLALVCAGCGDRAELINVREGLAETSRSIRQEHLELTHQRAATQPLIFALTTEDVEAREAAHDKFERILDESRSRDTAGPIARVPVIGPLLEGVLSPVTRGSRGPTTVPVATQ